MNTPTSDHEQPALTALLTEQGLLEYEAALREKGITEPHHLLRLTPTVIQSILGNDAKPIHERKLAALARGRNLHAASFSLCGEGDRSTRASRASAESLAPGGCAPFQSKSADLDKPERPGGLVRTGVSSPNLKPELESSIEAKFGADNFVKENMTKFLKQQGAVDAADLKYVDAKKVADHAKAAGAKPIQVNKIKDWVQTTAAGCPREEEGAPTTPEVAKPSRPRPSLRKSSSRLGRLFSDAEIRYSKDLGEGSTRATKRSSSANDVDQIGSGGGVSDPMHDALVGRLGSFYGEVVQGFLLTQGVVDEDDLMVRDSVRVAAAAETVGLKAVQIAKLEEWMAELKGTEKALKANNAAGSGILTGVLSQKVGSGVADGHDNAISQQ